MQRDRNQCILTLEVQHRPINTPDDSNIADELWRFLLNVRSGNEIWHTLWIIGLIGRCASLVAHDVAFSWNEALIAYVDNDDRIWRTQLIHRGALNAQGNPATMREISDMDDRVIRQVCDAVVVT